MTPDEYIWKQVEQVHEYLRFVGGQAMTWFAFGAGANTAAVWAIFGVALEDNVVPWIIVFANCLAAGACLFALPVFYIHSSRTLKSLTSQLSLFKDDAKQSLPVNPAFKLWLWVLISTLVGGLFVVVAGGWLHGICGGYFISRS